MSDEFFLPLFMQKANIHSRSSAARKRTDVERALVTVLRSDQARALVKLIGITEVKVPAQHFYHRINRKPADFDIKSLLLRIQHITGVTSQEEAGQYLRGYFQAAEILMGDKQKYYLSIILPPSLKLYIK